LGKQMRPGESVKQPQKKNKNQILQPGGAFGHEINIVRPGKKRDLILRKRQRMEGQGGVDGVNTGRDSNPSGI